MAQPDPDANVVIENQTPKRLIFEDDSEERFVLAPFEKRAIDADIFARFDLQELVTRGIVAVSPPPPPQSSDSIIGLGFWICIAYFVGGKLFHARYASAASGPMRWLSDYYWLWAGLLLLALIGAMVAAYYRRGADVLRMTVQWATLMITTLLTFGVPAFIVYRFGGGKEVLTNGPAGAIVGRGLQLLVIAIGSLLPALMYYLFDRQKLGTLRSRLEQQLVRLDPSTHDLRDVHAKYGRQFDEVYGSATASEARLVRATRWPILVATILTMAGWMLTLPFFRNFENKDDVLAYFSPPHNAVVFAFLGAYLYTLNSILRRYVRGDLKPKAYSSISVRIFVVMILAWVIELIASGAPVSPGSKIDTLDKTGVLLLAFFIGIIPETGLTWVQELVRKRVGKLALRIEEKHPLTDLEGIDIYDRGRLLDEGVTNIESLAHYDLVDLILDTRIPVPRIVDWLDQALLYLHIATPYAPLDSKNAKELAVASLRTTLRNYGIRTATDLMVAYGQAQGRNQKAEFLAAMRGEFPATAIEPVQVILDAMADDQWFDHISHWRKNHTTEEYRIKLLPLQLAPAVPEQPTVQDVPGPGKEAASAVAPSGT